ncbi:MAG: hypothetical protein R6U39_10245 [Candidatus Aegiribacteria sp.]
MKLVTVNELKELKEREGKDCISIMMSTTGKGADYQKNRIRFKTLLNRAEKELRELGVQAGRIESMLEPARELEKQRPYWKAGGDGLAAYISEGFFRTYRLPFPVEEAVLVSDSFNTRPLEYLVARERRYFLLALGLGDNRLFEATPHSIREIPSDSLTQGISETLRFDVFEKHLQGHSTSSVTRSGARMTFHGHDSEKEERRSKIRRYVKEVASETSSLFAGETEPLVIATLPYLLPDFIEACEYPHISPENVQVDPGHMEIEELHRRSLEKTEKIFSRELDAALENYGNAAAAGTATDDREELVRSAAEGRIETLLIDPEYAFYGSYHPDDRRVEINQDRRPGDRDLASFTVEETILKGGRVFTVDRDRMPNGRGAAAILRY